MVKRQETVLLLATARAATAVCCDHFLSYFPLVPEIPSLRRLRIFAPSLLSYRSAFLWRSCGPSFAFTLALAFQAPLPFIFVPASAAPHVGYRITSDDYRPFNSADWRIADPDDYRHFRKLKTKRGDEPWSDPEPFDGQLSTITDLEEAGYKVGLL